MRGEWMNTGHPLASLKIVLLYSTFPYNISQGNGVRGAVKEEGISVRRMLSLPLMNPWHFLFLKVKMSCAGGITYFIKVGTRKSLHVWKECKILLETFWIFLSSPPTLLKHQNTRAERVLHRLVIMLFIYIKK